MLLSTVSFQRTRQFKFSCLIWQEGLPEKATWPSWWGQGCACDTLQHCYELETVLLYWLHWFLLEHIWASVAALGCCTASLCVVQNYSEALDKFMKSNVFVFFQSDYCRNLFLHYLLAGASTYLGLSLFNSHSQEPIHHWILNKPLNIFYYLKKIAY